MKILVDEMPECPAVCPFNRTYKGVCVLSPWDAYICKDVADCPYLKVLEERDD